MVKSPPASRRCGFNRWVGKIPWRRKWQSTPVYCLENPMDGGAWKAAVHGVPKSQTRLSNFTSLHFTSNYGGGNEDNGDLLQKIPCPHCCTPCPQPCSRPPLAHASARDSWTLTGKSGSVSCRVTAPFSWVLVRTRFCLCPPRICFPSPV